MNQDYTFFLISTFTALVLALQLTHLWWRYRQRQALGYWVWAFWLFVLADLDFVLSIGLGSFWSRLISRILITAAYGLLLLAAQRTAGSKPRTGYVSAVIALYGIALYFLSQPEASPSGRVVLSRAIWGAFCLLGFLSLRRAGRHFWGAWDSPAVILLVQAIYLCLRALAYGLFPVVDNPTMAAIFTHIDYVDVVLFDVALFVALLVAFLNERNDEVAASQTEIQTLSGLLPICAWCKQVRDDAGYWHEISEYFARKNRIKITHGICQPCAKKLEDQATSSPVIKP